MLHPEEILLRKCGLGILISMLLAWPAVAAESLDGPSRGPFPGRAETGKPATKLLLIGGPFDGHPPGSHEYMQGTRIMETILQRMGDSLSIRVTNSEGEWLEGPNLVDSADGVVLFRDQGARWLQQDTSGQRLAAFQRLQARGGGLVALHMGMATVPAEPIDAFLPLYGACFGGPDRKRTEPDHLAQIRVPNPCHPISAGIQPFAARDEFYFDLKFAPSACWTPILESDFAGGAHAIAWAWERPDDGRSFGFTGLHMHDNWQLPEYRRLVVQAILWTLHSPVPADFDFSLPQ